MCRGRMELTTTKETGKFKRDSSGYKNPQRIRNALGGMIIASEAGESPEMGKKSCRRFNPGGVPRRKKDNRANCKRGRMKE